MATATTEFGIVYAVHIITVQFGSIVSKVCECLLRRGPLSWQDISRLAKSDISHNQVKDILLLLIQHNCVQAFSVEPPDGSESKATTQYIALYSNILHRVRFNKFSRLVNEELGKKCGGVLDFLLMRGRLTLGQLIKVDKGSGSDEKIGEEAVKDSLPKLVAARFVERIPSPEPVLGNKVEPTPKKKSAKGAKAAKVFKEPESLEERIVEAATPVESIRFPLIFEQITDSSLADDDSNISKGKRKHRDVDSSEQSKEVIWRPNFEEFIRRLRHKACVEIVKKHRDEACATVLKAMIDVGRLQETKVKTDKSVPMSLGSISEEVKKTETGRTMLLGSISEEVIKTEAGRTMLQERVEECLDQLSAESSYLPAFVIEADDSYIVDFKSIISVAQKDKMESLVRGKYCKAFRMFRYLSQEGCFVETDKLADATLTEKKDAPQILLKMWNDGYLDMQKLAIAAVSTPFLLWKVNKLKFSKQMLDEMYHFSLNLSLRLTHEAETDKEFLVLPERKKKFENKEKLLCASMFKNDDTIMLFHDF